MSGQSTTIPIHLRVQQQGLLSVNFPLFNTSQKPLKLDTVYYEGQGAKVLTVNHLCTLTVPTIFT